MVPSSIGVGNHTLSLYAEKFLVKLPEQIGITPKEGCKCSNCIRLFHIMFRQNAAIQHLYFPKRQQDIGP